MFIRSLMIAEALSRIAMNQSRTPEEVVAWTIGILALHRAHLVLQAQQ